MTTDIFYEYGRLCAAINAGITEMLTRMAEGYRSGAAAHRRALDAAHIKQWEDEARRERIAAFDVAVERERLAELDSKIQAARSRLRGGS